MIKLLLRLVANAAAIWVAAQLVDGVTLAVSPLGPVLIVALVFGVVNAVIKPIVKFFGFPFIVLTLGILSLVINAGLFALVAWLTDALSVSGFWPAFWGSIVVGLVSWFLGIFVDDKDDDD